jgi:hypothetical protein
MCLGRFFGILATDKADLHHSYDPEAKSLFEGDTDEYNDI